MSDSSIDKVYSRIMTDYKKMERMIEFFKHEKKTLSKQERRLLVKLEARLWFAKELLDWIDSDMDSKELRELGEKSNECRKTT